MGDELAEAQGALITTEEALEAERDALKGARAELLKAHKIAERERQVRRSPLGPSLGHLGFT